VRTGKKVYRRISLPFSINLRTSLCAEAKLDSTSTTMLDDPTARTRPRTRLRTHHDPVPHQSRSRESRAWASLHDQEGNPDDSRVGSFEALESVL
jgi:hypothetical protein